MSDRPQYNPKQRILVAQKKPKAKVDAGKKPPFGLLIGSFTITFLAIIFTIGFFRHAESAPRSDEITKNSKRHLKPAVPKVKKYNA